VYLSRQLLDRCYGYRGSWRTAACDSRPTPRTYIADRALRSNPLLTRIPQLPACFHAVRRAWGRARVPHPDRRAADLPCRTLAAVLQVSAQGTGWVGLGIAAGPGTAMVMADIIMARVMADGSTRIDDMFAVGFAPPQTDVSLVGVRRLRICTAGGSWGKAVSLAALRCGADTVEPVRHASTCARLYLARFLSHRSTDPSCRSGTDLRPIRGPCVSKAQLGSVPPSLLHRASPDPDTSRLAAVAPAIIASFCRFQLTIPPDPLAANCCFLASAGRSSRCRDAPRRCS
jgi:hypothetical protein